MKFPIIKVKDGDYVHIVGTNSHNELYIDNETGGIHYSNLQNGDGTIGQGEYGYKFTGVDNGCSPYPQIEFVTMDELISIYKEQIELSTEREIKLREFAKKIEENFEIYFADDYVDEDTEE